MDDKLSLIPDLSYGEVPEDLIEKDPRLYHLVVAKRALVAGYGEEMLQKAPATIIVDLIADVRHMCDFLNLDFYELYDLAYNYYLSEPHINKGVVDDAPTEKAE